MSHSGFPVLSRPMNMVQNAILDHSNIVKKSKAQTTGAFSRKDLKSNLEQLSQEERKDLVHLIRSNRNTKNWNGVSSWKNISVLNPNPDNMVFIDQPESRVLNKLEKEAELYQKVFTQQERAEEKKESDSWTKRLPDIAKIANSIYNRIFGVSTKELMREMKSLIQNPSPVHYTHEEIQRDAHFYVDDLYQEEEKKISATLKSYNSGSSKFNPSDGYKQWISRSTHYLQDIIKNSDFAKAVAMARGNDISYCEGHELSHLKAMKKKLELDIKHSKVDTKIGANLLKEVNASIKILENINLDKCKIDNKYKDRCVAELNNCRSNMEELIKEIDSYIEKIQTYQKNLKKENLKGYDLYVRTYQQTV